MTIRKKHWSGDSKLRLPEKKVTPYKLWFEALQLAHSVDGLKINKEYYKDWGDVVDVKFNDWWSQNWRNLFGVSLGVRQIDDEDDYKSSVDENSMIVRIPFNQTWSKTEKELKAILITKPETDKELGQYHLSKDVLRLDTKGIRISLMVYEYQLDGYDIYDTSTLISDWYNNWVKKGKYYTYPSALGNLANDIKLKNDVSSRTSNYRSAMRIRKRGQRIVENVANGEFPGKY